MDDSVKLIGFLPWLNLERQVSIAGFDFIPFLNEASAVTSSLAGLKNSFPRILSSYHDLQGRPLSSCTVVVDRNAQNPNEAWNLFEDRIEDARYATSLLFLAGWAANDYFMEVGSYVNDTYFQLYFQRFTEPVDFVSLKFRKRDGSVLYGGPRHGEMHFTMPIQSSASILPQIAVDFLASLDAAAVASSPTLERLKTVLPLVRLANTDNDVMTFEAEIALMGFAFEQYFSADKARVLADKFDNVFGVYGITTARVAKTSRPGIYPDPDKKYTDAQFNWVVAKIWMLEFHQYRSAVAHGKSLSDRTWGWTPSEHLVMAAFVFPLIVKLNLVQEGHYLLSREDEAGCKAVDVILSQTDWAVPSGSSIQRKWQNIIRAQKREIRVSDAVKQLQADLEASDIVKTTEANSETFQSPE